MRREAPSKASSITARARKPASLTLSLAASVKFLERTPLISLAAFL